ncbi:MAG: sigma-70 family RNA polymerase sigma factor [Myxococcales bacterium]|nr:sigma-70 family RNA polymerase sigma factor [Myxococcales bacterium]
MTTPLSRAFAEHGRFLFALLYRMTGSASEAEDLVQQTFERALVAEPDVERPLRPWLVRVGTNLARDALRARRKRGYVGPWLPEPIPSDEASLVGFEVPSTEGRYELLESVSFGFLLALEALTPNQRAVLLLRDVLEYDVAESASALGLGEANVKVLHHRARKAMAAYEQRRARPTSEAARAVLEAFLTALAAGDGPTLERLVREDVRMLNDGGGVVSAARVPILGRDKALLFLRKLAALRGPPEFAEIRAINGGPALVARFSCRTPIEPRDAVMTLELDHEGRVAACHWVVHPAKLRAVGLGDAQGFGVANGLAAAAAELSVTRK